MKSEQEWDGIASLYDDLFGSRRIDIPFWQDMSRRYGPDILELCCGTGRLTFPMAKTGARITGLDISVPMLARAQKKLSGMRLPGRVAFIHGDARAPSMRNRFSAIFSPWGFPPTDETETAAFLESAGSLLVPGGHIVIDCINAAQGSREWDRSSIRDVRTLPGRGITVVRQIRQRHDPRSGTTTIRTVWGIIRRGGRVQMVVAQRREFLYTPEKMTALFRQHGFAVADVFGDYRKHPRNEKSPRTIIVARR